MAVNIKKEFGNSRNRKPDLTTMIYGKVPPQDVKMEEAVLGSCLNENGRSAFEAVLGVFTDSEVFYADSHQKIFLAMLRLYEDARPIDMILVTNELRKTNELEIVGGAVYLMDLARAVVTDAHIEYHCRVVLEKYIGRELIRISGQTINDAYDGGSDVLILTDNACDAFYKILSGNIQKGVKQISDGVREVAEKMQQQKESANELTGIPTPFDELNKITNGWQKTDVTILAARPSVGKTAFMLALAECAASNLFPTAIFSLEMGQLQLIERMVSAKSGVEMSQIKHPKNMTQDEWDRSNKAMAELSMLPIYIDDTAGITANEMRAKCRKLKQKHGIELLLIDYLQLMSGTGKEGNREQEIAKISREIKKMAKDLEISIIALSQLNRGLEGSNGEASRDPKLSDLRESGAIEQDADNVLFLSNPSAKMIQELPSFMGRKLVSIAKGRNIGLGNIALDFNHTTQKWKDPAKINTFEQEQQIPDRPAAGITRQYRDITEPKNNYNPNDWANQ